MENSLLQNVLYQRDGMSSKVRGTENRKMGKAARKNCWTTRKRGNKRDRGNCRTTRKEGRKEAENCQADKKVTMGKKGIWRRFTKMLKETKVRIS